MTGDAAWPFPGDSPVVRARRIALAYRVRLAEVDPEGCERLDQQVRRWGQNWAVTQLHHFDLDDWLSVREAADLASVQTRQIAAWRRNGRLRGRLSGDRWQYRARDVMALATNPRYRAKRGESA